MAIYAMKKSDKVSRRATAKLHNVPVTTCRSIISRTVKVYIWSKGTEYSENDSYVLHDTGKVKVGDFHTLHRTSWYDMYKQRAVDKLTIRIVA